ncbi:recombinase RecT [Spiroplasma endosymbiont of Virgichneumon dumeticola]|uniref:recombinase RecT n=1 Tax=Spiroplasma endosymbiont of Virgichneumon dumeticola TaxID=3139323 RepID=UPI0035C8F62B
MANELIIKNINNGNVEKYIKNKGIINNLEIQKFKSNVLAISNQYGLDKAHPETIINSCYQAVLLNLPLDKNFGYCYVVPYWDNKEKINNAQFQMGYKGYIQLSLRSQQYKEINVSDVRLTEIEKVDRLKGIEFNWIQNDLERLKQPIIGYVAYFQLINGFEKTLYMSKEQIEKHFLKYSKTYAKNKEFIVSDFDSMALKTVLTQLLRKWGIMSTEMQIAYESDQAIITETEKIYIDNPNNDNKEIKLKEIEETKEEININYEQIQNNINNLDKLVFSNE